MFKFPPVSNVPIERQNAVIRAWKSEYLGNAHKIMLRAIDEVHQNSVATKTAKIVAVVQSSCMGKSRTVDEIAKERILFPLCLREDIGPDSFAYPLSDDVVREHLLSAPDAQDEAKCMAYLRAFLCSFFTHAHLQAEQLFPMSETVSYAHVARTFYDLFNTPASRHKFHLDVIAQSKLMVDVSPTVLSQACGTLHEYLKQRCSDWPATTACPMLISMDEAHVLVEPRRQDFQTHHTVYSRMKLVLGQVYSSPFCTTVLSTAISIAKSTPSMRGWTDADNSPVTITELPFDVHVIADPPRPGQHDLNSVGTMELTAKFGRPWFFADYLSRKSHDVPSEVVHRMMWILSDKLYGHSWPPQSWERGPSGVSSIAILSPRLCLDLSPASPHAREYEEELVRAHMRILYSVQNDSIIVTGSSSEPLMAEASAQIMNYVVLGSADRKPLFDVWGSLGEFVRVGLAAQGTVGELIGRALSMTAMDKAINALGEVCELKYQTPVSVAAYYRALLTEEAWETLRLSVPANGAALSPKARSVTFEEAFEKAYFRFSHYGKAGDAAPMKDGYAWANWLRGTAIFWQFEGVRVHYIYFSEEGKIGPAAMSVELNHDMTGRTTDPEDVGVQSAEQLEVFSHGNPLPYIAAVHCYALTDDEGLLAMQEADSLDLGGEVDDDDEQAPRYQIDFRGLAAYGNITDADKEVIRSMMSGSRDYLFRSHWRRDALDLVRQMLPVLDCVPSSTAWLGGMEDIVAPVGDAGPLKGGR